MDKNLLFCIIVDDEPLAQQVLENYVSRIPELELVAKCETAEEALEVLSSRKIDLVFLDLHLNTTNGTEILTKKKLVQGRYYIIVTSASLSNELNIKEAFNTEDVILIEYLKKPFSFNQFSAAIHKLLGILERSNI